MHPEDLSYLSNPATVAALVSLVTTLVALSVTARRFREEFMLQSRAETVALALLRHRRWGLRSFSKIKSRLGGFEDDELRRVLVRAGAVRFYATDGEEFWGLLDRNRQIIDEQEIVARGSARAAAHSAAPPVRPA